MVCIYVTQKETALCVKKLQILSSNIDIWVMHSTSYIEMYMYIYLFIYFSCNKDSCVCVLLITSYILMYAY